MNERARDVLVTASLSGHHQLKHQMHGATDDEGDCVLGALHLALHTTRDEARECLRYQLRGQALAPLFIWAHLRRVYDLTFGEYDALVYENDELGWDFLTIARKHTAET